jgi:lipid-binding SYLF domain-containing protein
MKKFCLLALVAVISASLGRATERTEYVTRIESCEAILQGFMADRAYAIPPMVWQRARGVIITNQFKAGFIFGVKGGNGVVMVKKADGKWSLPVMIDAGEASLGLQVGGKTVETVYIITDDQTPRKLFQGRFNVGVDANAVAGPKWAEVESVNKEILETPVLVYTKAKGLFAGATLKAGYITRNDDANREFYNTEYTMPELLYGNFVQPPKEVIPLMNLVSRLAP